MNIEYGMLFALLALAILFSVGITLDSRAYQKKLKKDAEETDRLYKEASEWYNQLPVEKKADIMDILWDSCPSPKNGKKYMISIYQYYTQEEKEL